MGSSHSKKKSSPPTPPSTTYYSVENNNWAGNVGAPDYWNDRSAKGKYEYTVSTKPGDPAKGCAKTFTSNYKCSTNTDNTKTISLTAEANGQKAIYDCSEEYELAIYNRFYVYDNGNCAIINVKTNEIIWQSGTTGQYGLKDKSKKASASKFGRNYMAAGETLFPGEFIGSPSGNCYVQLVKNDSTGNYELKIMYSIAAVAPDGVTFEDDAGKNAAGTMGDIGNSSLGSFAVYRVNEFNGKDFSTENADERKYVDYNYNTRLLHSKLQDGYSTEYTNIGTFDQVGQHEINKLSNSDLDNCKQSCDGQDDCAGFVFNNADKTCSLKNSGMFPADLNRRFNRNAEMYVRGKKWKTDGSCSQNTTVIYQDQFDRMNKLSPMSSNTVCDLKKATSEQQKILKEKEDALMKMAGNVKQYASDLKEKNDILSKKISNSLAKYQGDVKENAAVEKQIVVRQNEYENVNAMEESSKQDLISNNYQYLAFTGVAALGVIAAIKATK